MLTDISIDWSNLPVTDVYPKRIEDPLGNDLVIGRDGNLAFGQSTAMSGRSLSGGGFPSFYSFGGPRTLRLSVRLMF